MSLTTSPIFHGANFSYAPILKRESLPKLNRDTFQYSDQSLPCLNSFPAIYFGTWQEARRRASSPAARITTAIMAVAIFVLSPIGSSIRTSEGATDDATRSIAASVISSTEKLSDPDYLKRHPSEKDALETQRERDAIAYLTELARSEDYQTVVEELQKITTELIPTLKEGQRKNLRLAMDDITRQGTWEHHRIAAEKLFKALEDTTEPNNLKDAKQLLTEVDSRGWFENVAVSASYVGSFAFWIIVALMIAGGLMTLVSARNLFKTLFGVKK